MNFLSASFLALFAVLVFILYFVKDVNKQNTILLVFSLIMYGITDFRFVIVLLSEIAVCYLAGKVIRKNEENKKIQKIALNVSIVYIVGLLAVFKYYGFFIESFSKILGISDNNISNILIPLGISYYSFLGISFISDVYLKKISDFNIVSVALYLSYFVHITSGPITKASELIPRFSLNRIICYRNISEGFQIFIFGALKKIVIADRLSVYVNQVYSAPVAYSGITLICTAVSFTIQLYCDFSGYSDMAIGLSKILGIELKRNFNMPFAAKNATDLWKRWHISLSEWLQTYVYIPLGGNRKGIVRTYINLMITMIICGLWHGSSIKFAIWGLLQGIGLIIHKLYVKYMKTKNLYPVKNKIYELVSFVFTFIYFCIGLIIFRINSYKDIYAVFKKVITFDSGIDYIYVYSFICVLLVLVAHIIGLIKGNGEGFYPIFDLNKMYGKIIVSLVVVTIVVFGYYGNTAFIYAQF